MIGVLEPIFQRTAGPRSASVGGVKSRNGVIAKMRNGGGMKKNDESARPTTDAEHNMRKMSANGNSDARVMRQTTDTDRHNVTATGSSVKKNGDTDRLDELGSGGNLLTLTIRTIAIPTLIPLRIGNLDAANVAVVCHVPPELLILLPRGQQPLSIRLRIQDRPSTPEVATILIIHILVTTILIILILVPAILVIHIQFMVILIIRILSLLPMRRQLFLCLVGRSKVQYQAVQRFAMAL
jgi:hypothetical protein